MPATQVYFYQNSDGTSDTLNWLRDLATRQPKAYAKCAVKIQLLRDFGNELRRPHADFLRDNIYELRARDGNVQYRILYFFHGSNIAIVCHGLSKESAIPPNEIEVARQRREQLIRDPAKHIKRDF